MKLFRLFHRSLAMLIVVLLASSACSSDDEQVVVIPPEAETLTLSSPESNVTITDNGTIANVAMEPVGGSVNIIVTTALEWTFKAQYEGDSKEWAEITLAGRGIRISADKFNENDSRQVKINITAEGETKATINVTQTGMGADASLFVESYSITSPDNGRIVTLEVLTNQDTWEFETDKESEEWLEVVKKDEHKMTLFIAPNQDREAKSTIVKVKGITDGETTIEKEVEVNLWGQSLVFEVEVAKNDKIVLPLTGDVDIELNWGDDSLIYSVKENVTHIVQLIEHKYLEAGTYEIRINGKADGMSFAIDNAWADTKAISKYTEIKQWGNMGFKSLKYGLAYTNITYIPEDEYNVLENVEDCFGLFMGCGKLTYVPENLFKSMTRLQDVGSIFNKCRALTEIPANLFAHNKELKRVAKAFTDCESLTSIPETIFANNTEIVNIEGVFSGTGITSISDKVFANNTKVVNAKSIFSSCSSLKEIPANLLASMPEITDLYAAFWATGITSIPKGLLKNNPNVTSFHATFNQTPLKEIPADLFANCKKATNFQSTFYKCLELESIPAGLFDACTEALDVNQLFSGCKKLKTIPAGLFDKMTKVTKMDLLFNDCELLESIPVGLFDKNTEVTTFASAFRYCASLQSIPNKLFANNKKVTEINEVFRGCKSITTLPADLFAANEVLKAGSIFRDCGELTTIETGAFDSFVKCTDFGYAFQNCPKLSSVPVTLFDRCLQVKTFSYIFNGCIEFTGESPYTMVGENKVHLYERNNYLDTFTKVTSNSKAFYNCKKLTDYDIIPTNWK